MIESGMVLLHTADLARSARFFIETMGFKLVEQTGPHWAIIDAGGGLRLALHSKVEGAAAKAASNAIAIGFKVRSDFDAALAVYENRGVKFRVEQNARVRLAHFEDPDGHPMFLSA